MKAADCRNFTIAGHSGSGKTTLAELMLFKAKDIDRRGSIEQKNTASDYTPEEQEKQCSLNSATLHLDWKGKNLFFNDTPGYAEFVGEVVSCMRAADSAMVLVDAVDGPQIGTARSWKMARDRKIPAIGVISRLDRERADFAGTLEKLRETHGRGKALPITWPVGAEADLKKVVNVLFDKDIPADIAAVVPDTNTPIVCYCRQYKRAAQAAMMLDSLGYRRVKFVGDGYEASKSAPRLSLSDVTTTLAEAKAGKTDRQTANNWQRPYPSAKGKPNKGWSGKPLSIAGVEYACGAGTRAGTRGGGALIQCRIPEGSTHFIAMVGVDDNTPVKNCSVVFKVEVEGRELAKTRPMSLGDAHLIAVPLPADAKMIKLFATAKFPVHAAWAGAGFRKAP